MREAALTALVIGELDAILGHLGEEQSLLEAVLPPDLAMELGSSHLLLALDVEVAGEVPGSVLATHGSPVLDRLVALAAGFDSYFALQAPQKELRPPRVLGGLEAVTCPDRARSGPARRR